MDLTEATNRNDSSVRSPAGEQKEMSLVPSNTSGIFECCCLILLPFALSDKPAFFSQKLYFTISRLTVEFVFVQWIGQVYVKTPLARFLLWVGQHRRQPPCERC